MKKKTTIELAVKDLRPALAGLAKVILRKPALPVLGCVRIEPDPADAQKVLLTGTDLDTWITLGITGTIANAGQAFPLLVPLADLREAAKGGGADGGLDIRQEDNGHVSLSRHIGTGIVTRSAECGDMSDYPEEPEVKAASFDLDAHAREGLQQALRCCSGDPTRQVLHGALLEEGKTFVGTDGRHLYRCNGMELPVKDPVVIAQHKVMDWPPLRDSTDWRLAVGKDWFRLSGKDWQVASRLVEGNYPNWRQVMPQEGDYRSSVELAPGGLDQMVATIASMPGEKQNSKPVGLRLAQGTCSLLARNGGGGVSSEVPLPDATVKGPDATVFLNRDYLAKALGFGLNHIDIIDDKSPLRFRSSGADGRDMVVMPVRMFDPSPAGPRTPEPRTPDPEQPQPTERKSEPMKDNSQNGESNNGGGNNHQNGDSNGGNGHHPQADPSPQTDPSPLETAAAQVTALREQLRQAAVGLTEVATTLKQVRSEQKSTEKEVRQVRSTIRSLQRMEL